MTIARNPLHGSGRAALPHPALASGDNAKPPQGIGVTNARGGQPPLDEPAHPLPGDVPCMTAPCQRAVPEPADPEPEQGYRWAVHGHAVVADVPTHDLTEPCTHHWDWVVQTPPKLGFDLAQLRLQPLPDRLPHHRESSVPLLPADMREAEENRTSPASPCRPAAGARPRTARTPAGGSSRGAAPGRTSRTAHAAQPGTARHPPGAETPR